MSLSEDSLAQHTSLRAEEQIACLGLGSRWPPNGRQLGRCLHSLPPCGMYRCPRSQATRAAISHPMPPPVETFKEGWSMLRWSWFSFFSGLVRFSFSHIGYYFNVFVWLWKIGKKHVWKYYILNCSLLLRICVEIFIFNYYYTHKNSISHQIICFLYLTLTIYWFYKKIAYKKMVLNLKKCHFSCMPNKAPGFYIFIMEKCDKSQKNNIFLACQTGPKWNTALSRIKLQVLWNIKNLTI